MSATASRAQPGTATSFARRRIDVSFALATQATPDLKGALQAPKTFDGTSGANVVTVSGLRCSAAITNQGGISQGALDLRVYGMTESLMNTLSQVSKMPLAGDFGNKVTVSAGVEGASLAVTFLGTISGAWADYSGAPDVPFHVTAFSALEAAVKSVPPSSYKGGADVAVIMADLARLMNMRFENNGVSGIILSNPYFPGTAYQQMESCRDAAGIEAHVINGTLAIWPRGGSRGGAVPLISPETGLVGYPIRTNLGVDFTTLYNPAIHFGAKVQLQSPRVPQASGTWQVKGLQHTLESETPSGAWFSRLSCAELGFIQ